MQTLLRNPFIQHSCRPAIWNYTTKYEFFKIDCHCLFSPINYRLLLSIASAFALRAVHKRSVDLFVQCCDKMSDADRIKGAKTVSSFPEGYEVPEIWKEPQPMGGTFGSINKPTAGARTEKARKISRNGDLVSEIAVICNCMAGSKAIILMISHFWIINF